MPIRSRPRVPLAPAVEFINAGHLLGSSYARVIARRAHRLDVGTRRAGEIMRWLDGFSHPPRMTYLVHGDPVALTALSKTIGDGRQWPVHIAAHLERVELPA